jgi:pyruvate formate lyase activating enzyme
MVRFAAVTPRPLIAPHTVVGEHTHVLADGRVRCDVCPRACTMREGQAGFCFVREARGGEVVMTSYGRASGFCVDPIEKKPLNHFSPGHQRALVRHGGLQPRLPLLPELGHLEGA